MGNVYIGVSNKARKVKNIYIGVSNKARKVSKAYVGVSNKARLIYSSSSGVDPTKSEFTEAEINALAAYGELGQVNVGATVTLANSYDTNRSIHTYVIIGKNHDGTINTADLWTTGCINTQIFSDSSNNNNLCKRWLYADIRYYGNDTYKTGFSSTTQSHMKQMIVKTYYGSMNNATPNDTTKDYIKVLSVKEFNLSSYHQSMNNQEGNAYSDYFPSRTYAEFVVKRYASATGTAGTTYQWTRSCLLGTSLTRVWCVGSSGNFNNMLSNANTSFGYCPCFRLGA